MSKNINLDEHMLTLTVPILHRSTPYVYVRCDTQTNRYRLSANYKYLNEQYQLKINFIRDLDKINLVDNSFFSIVDNTIILKNSDEWQTWNMGTPSNGLLVSRIIVSDNKEKNSTTSLIVLKRNFNNELNYSIFFASTKYYTIDQFIGGFNVI